MGLFTMENGSENYCTLCGDGGQIICCDDCEKCCCEECIARISGPQVLRKLVEDEAASWKCYVCSPEPLARSRRMCQRLLEYYQKRKELARKRLKNLDSGGGSMTSNSELSDCGSGVNDLSRRRPPRSSSSSEGGGVGFSGSQARGGQKEGGRSAAAGKGGGGREDSKKRGGKGQEKKSGSGGGGARSNSSGSAVGGGQHVRGGGLLGSDDFESSSSSSAGEELPEVHTDDISMSDSDMFDEDTHFRRKKRKKLGGNRKADEEEASSSSTAKDKAGAGVHVSTLESSVAGPSNASKLGGLKKQNRVRRRELQWSDSSSDFEVQTSSKKLQKKQLQSPSSEEEETEKSSVGKRKGRRSKLACAVSSGSESETEVVGKQLSVSMQGQDSDHSSGEDLRSNASGSTSSNPVKYVTSNGILDSSDSDVGRRKKGKKRVRSSPVSDDSGRSSTDASGGKPGRKRAKGRRAKEHSDDDDFVSAQDLSLMGPRIKRRPRKRAIFSSSDSGSEGDVEEEEENEKEKGSENEEGRKLTSSAAEDDTPTKGQKRKKLRKLISDSKLAVSTKEAQTREKQRIERLEKLRKQMGDKKEDTDRLVLEMDPEGKEVRVEVRRSLLPKMKPHQRQGTKFLYEACVERLEQLKSGEQGGAILAHCMGLGKTLQVIAVFAL